MIWSCGNWGRETATVCFVHELYFINYWSSTFYTFMLKIDNGFLFARIWVLILMVTYSLTKMITCKRDLNSFNRTQRCSDSKNAWPSWTGDEETRIRIPVVHDCVKICDKLCRYCRSCGKWRSWQHVNCNINYYFLENGRRQKRNLLPSAKYSLLMMRPTSPTYTRGAC